jgi:hypothetical protein
MCRRTSLANQVCDVSQVSRTRRTCCVSVVRRVAHVTVVVSTPLEARVSAQWSKLGFQGHVSIGCLCVRACATIWFWCVLRDDAHVCTCRAYQLAQDPATDFRGYGVLGLDALLYFATQHTPVWQVRVCARS